MLADRDRERFDAVVGDVRVIELDLRSGEFGFEAEAEIMEERAFEPEARAAEAGTVIVVIAAAPSEIGCALHFDRAPRLEGEIAAHVAEQRRGAAACPLDFLRGANLNAFHPRLSRTELLLERGVAHLERVHLGLERVQPIHHHIAGFGGDGRHGRALGGREIVKRGGGRGILRGRGRGERDQRGGEGKARHRTGHLYNPC